MMNFRTSVLLIAPFVLAGCGGGGGAPPSTPFVADAEYFSQGGLDLINASAMYLLGGTGNGVSVAVFDTGGSFSHPDLAGAYSSSRYTLYGSLDDGQGHGTQVAGIIAARRNGTGMQGVAYNATIVSYKVLDNSGAASALSDAAWAGAITTMTNTNVMITNNSWGSVGLLVTSVSAASVTASNPLTLAAYRAYDAAGGVQVWAIGNDYSSQPNLESGLPFLFADLQSSWLAVMAVDLNGNEPVYTNQCGVAAAWCLAAPGSSINSTARGGGYTLGTGTSFAAPQVSGAIAALKSMFPSLSFQQVRDRILVTANKSGQYANTSIFGQGLLDLAAASAPVGGASLAISNNTNGATAPLSNAAIKLPAGALAQYAGTQNILILDNYQRAPFLVPLDSFTQTRRSYLSLRDLGFETEERRVSEGSNGLALAMAGRGYRIGASSNGAYLTGFGQGSEVMDGFARLTGAAQPHSQFRMQDDAFGAVAGYRTKGGTLYAAVATGRGEIADEAAGTGIASWAPGSVLAITYLPDGKNRAYGLSLATALQKPMGWSGTGAFAVSGDSIGLGFSQQVPLSERLGIGLSGRLAYVTAGQTALVQLDNALVAAAGVEMRLALTGRTTFKASFGIEQPISASTGTLRTAGSVSSSGQITYQNTAFDQAALMSFRKAAIGIEYHLSENIKLSAGASTVRDGYGTTDAIVGIGARLRF